MKIKNENQKHAYGTKEWSKTSVNVQNGCEKNCRYCYAKGMAVRHKRKTPENWHKNPEFRMHAIEKGYRKRSGTIMFPSSHDISPRNIDHCVTVLRKMLKSGNDVLIVSKPTLSCIKHLCAELKDYKAQILFRFTIGSVDDAVLRYWEQGAPSFSERLESLKWAFSHGFETSISSEPMLDTDPHAVIRATKPYVTDAVWLGRVNNLRQAISLNCPNDFEAKDRANELLAKQTDEWLVTLYERYKNDSKIKFKDSIKKAAGIDRPTEAGLDI